MNSLIKITLVSFCILLFSSCMSSKTSNKNEVPFTLLKATSENWRAGIKQGGSGIEYSFVLKVNEIKNISFDSVWVNDQRLSVKIVRNGKIVVDHSQIVSGDNIKIRCSGNDDSTEKIASPKKLKENTVLFRYISNKNDFNYYLVENIVKTKSTPRQ